MGNRNAINRVDEWALNSTSSVLVMNHDSLCAGLFIDINGSFYPCPVSNILGHLQEFLAQDQMNATTVTGFGAIVYFILSRPSSVVLDASMDGYNHQIIRSIPNGFKCSVGCIGNLLIPSKIPTNQHETLKYLGLNTQRLSL
jgi:hypothetical protein